jgi:hypothetical protein
VFTGKSNYYAPEEKKISECIRLHSFVNRRNDNKCKNKKRKCSQLEYQGLLNLGKNLDIVIKNAVMGSVAVWGLIKLS